RGRCAHDAKTACAQDNCKQQQEHFLHSKAQAFSLLFRLYSSGQTLVHISAYSAKIFRVLLDNVALLLIRFASRGLFPGK
ncbi:hypothetical protein, partial [Paenibacillus sp. A3]|uniref:hypothetical protein n=1 Tax=Paenibacillus sp. A3 TaxID=1337054 RepID=UPI001ED9A149